MLFSWKFWTHFVLGHVSLFIFMLLIANATGRFQSDPSPSLPRPLSSTLYSFALLQAPLATLSYPLFCLLSIYLSPQPPSLSSLGLVPRLSCPPPSLYWCPFLPTSQPPLTALHPSLKVKLPPTLASLPCPTSLQSPLTSLPLLPLGLSSLSLFTPLHHAGASSPDLKPFTLSSLYLL